jgi:hypothetical protein
VFDQVKVGDKVDITWNTELLLADIFDRHGLDVTPRRGTPVKRFTIL